MARTNKGGIRLRVITGLTAAMAIAAGVYAGYGHRTAPYCDIVPTTIVESNVVQVNCYMLSGSTTYNLLSDASDFWDNASGLGTGSGTSAGNAAGFSGGPVSFTTNPLGLATIWLNTSAETTVAATQLTVQDLSMPPNNVAVSDTADAYHITFDDGSNFTDNQPTGGSGALLVLNGLLGSESVTVSPVDTSDSPDISGWDGTGPSGSGTSGSPYKFSGTSPYPLTFTASSSAESKYFATTNPGLGNVVNTKYRITIAGTEVGLSDLIQIQGH